MWKTITKSTLEKVLTYNPDTGIFTRAASVGGYVAGSVAGGQTSWGYISIRVHGVRYLAHRLAWLWMTGHMPDHEIDHINGNRTDNRFRNLRDATKAENMQNLVARRPHGLLGVSYASGRQKWRACIGVSGRYKSLGYHDTPEAAYAAYLIAKSKLHIFQPIPRASLRTKP